jgi:hypothetical protein
MITPTQQIGATPINTADTRRVRAERADSARTGDTLSTASAVGLQTALAATPEIRPEVVARIEKLAVDLNYPPREIIDRIANLIALSRDPSVEGE